MDGKIYYRSSAALQIIRRLDGPISLLYGFILVPVILRDALYNLVARKRYKWFGRSGSCMVPSPGLMNRFIDN